VLKRAAAIALSLVVAMAALHCGETLNTETSSTPDAANADGGPASDEDVTTTSDSGAPTGKPCDWNAPFEQTTLLSTTVNTPELEADPKLSGDELTLYFTRGEPGRTFVAVATRKSTTEPFGPATELTELRDPINPVISVSNAFVTADELTIVFSRGTNPYWDLFMASRGSRIGAFTNEITLSPLNISTTSEINAYLMPDKRTLYFASNRSSIYQIFRTQLGGDADAGDAGDASPASAPEVVSIPGIDASTMGALEPVLSEDELTMWFGKRNPMQEDIWVTHRSAKNEPWGDPTEITILTTEENRDLPGWISKDMCRLYFSRGPYPSGNLDLWVATRTPKK